MGRGLARLAIREQQGGSQIASAISTIAGGAIIIAAAVCFWHARHQLAYA